MGGKSRKSGGVSKKLIAMIRSGGAGKSSCGNNSTKTTKDGQKQKGIFDLD